MSGQSPVEVGQVAFPHIIADKYLLPSADPASIQKRVNIEKFLADCSRDSFKSFLINSKKEVLVIAIKASFLRNYLSSIGLRNPSEEAREPFYSSYLKWSVYFLDQMNEVKSTREFDASPQGGDIEPSFYLDKKSDVFFCFLPFDVEFKADCRPGDEMYYRIGVKLSYDLLLAREKVFRYQEMENFASYLIEVQSKSKSSMIENLFYTTRLIQIKTPLSIHSGFSSCNSDIYLKFYVKNELTSFPNDDTIPVATLLGSYFENREPASTNYFELYTQRLNSFQLKFESSVNQDMDTKILNDYLSFLDYQLLNSSNATLLKPGESFSVIYKVSRRELLKYKKNKTMIYLESPLVNKLKGICV